MSHAAAANPRSTRPSSDQHDRRRAAPRSRPCSSSPHPARPGHRPSTSPPRALPRWRSGPTSIFIALAAAGHPALREPDIVKLAKQATRHDEKSARRDARSAAPQDGPPCRTRGDASPVTPSAPRPAPYGLTRRPSRRTRRMPTCRRGRPRHADWAQGPQVRPTGTAQPAAQTAEVRDDHPRSGRDLAGIHAPAILRALVDCGCARCCGLPGARESSSGHRAADRGPSRLRRDHRALSGPARRPGRPRRGHRSARLHLRRGTRPRARRRFHPGAQGGSCRGRGRAVPCPQYGEATLAVQEGAVRLGSKVVVVDDILATGGTAVAACALLERVGADVVGVVDVVLELSDLGGRAALAGRSVYSVTTD